MAASQVDAVRQLAVGAVGQAGLVLEDVTIGRAGRRRVVRVVVDLPDDQVGGVPMEAVAEAAQALSTILDGSDVLGQTPYTLEVTSPGAERSLVERRHWSRARGRLVTVTLTDDSIVEGRLREVDEAGLTLDGATLLPWETVHRGRVRLDFSGQAQGGG